MSRRASSPPAARSIESRRPGGAALWTAADGVLILLFAASGRRTHEHGLTPAGILETAWPFLLAYLATALISRVRKAVPGKPWPTGIVLWIGTVAGGLLLRALSGTSVAASFQVVTLLVLGTFLLLPRLLGLVLTRGRTQNR